MHRHIFLVRAKNRRAQFDPYLRMNQFHQIRRGFAAAKLQIAAGVFRQMHDIVCGVNHDRGRTILFQEFQVQLAKEQRPALLSSDGSLQC